MWTFFGPFARKRLGLSDVNAYRLACLEARGDSPGTVVDVRAAERPAVVHEPFTSTLVRPAGTWHPSSASHQIGRAEAFPFPAPLLSLPMLVLDMKLKPFALGK